MTLTTPPIYATPMVALAMRNPRYAPLVAAETTQPQSHKETKAPALYDRSGHLAKSNAGGELHQLA